MKAVNNNSTSSKYVTNEELKTIQDIHADFTRAKTAVGELELQKHQLLKHIDEIKNVFSQHEQMLIEKYGKDAIINMKTGEITEKAPDNIN
jgi:hypothetical protein